MEQVQGDKINLAIHYICICTWYLQLAICMTHMGDAVEIYLPAILTQNISCDLKLNDTKQGILSVVFYSFYAVGKTGNVLE